MPYIQNDQLYLPADDCWHIAVSRDTEPVTTAGVTGPAYRTRCGQLMLVGGGEVSTATTNGERAVVDSGRPFCGKCHA